MPWEQRGSQRYYYRSRKENGRVLRQYLGRGPRAIQAAAEDAERHTTRHQGRLERKAWEALESQVASLDTLITFLSHAHLLNAGWYRHHRGDWRKRRHDGSHDGTLPTES